MDGLDNLGFWVYEICLFVKVMSWIYYGVSVETKNTIACKTKNVADDYEMFWYIIKSAVYATLAIFW